MRKKIILISILALLLIVFHWFFTHSFIEVSVNDNGTGRFNFTLTDVSSQKQTHGSSTKTLKKLVRKSQYEVLVQNGETSYFSVANTGRFLSTTSIQANLAPEKSRKFVGNNPGTCMYYVGHILASVECGDFRSQLKLHVPASAQQPTYTRSGPGIVDGIIEGSVVTSQGTVLLMRSTASTNHSAYILGPDLGLNNKVLMTDLDNNKTYYMQNYKDGFVVYDDGFGKVLYYSSISSSPILIKLTRPDDEKLMPIAISVQGSTIIMTYSNDLSSDVHESGQDKTPENPKPPKKITSVLSIHRDNYTKQFSFKKSISDGRLCGTNKLCILSSNQLEIYDITKSKPQILYSVGGVEQIDFVNNELIVVKNGNVIGLDVDKKSGSIQYGFGEYSFCGYTPSNQGYTICISKSDQNKAALFVDTTMPNNGSIDKKILPLMNLADITALSVYDKYIFVSPNLGEVVFKKDLGSFGYDTATTETVNKNIDQVFEASGIDKNFYQLMNPFKQ